MRRHLKTLIIGGLVIATAWGLVYFRAVTRVLDLFRAQSQQQEKPFQPASPLLTQPVATMSVKLYFPSLKVPGRLEGEPAEIRASALDQNRAKQIVLKLIEGSKLKNGRTLSSETVLRELFLTDDGTAFVNFSDAIRKNHPGGVECELETVYSIVNSLTVNIPSIKRVRFLVEDGPAETLAGHVDLGLDFTQDLDYVVKPQAPAAAGK